MEDPKQSVDNEEAELTRLTPPSRYCNIAVRVKDCIVVTGGINTCTCGIKKCTCAYRRLPLNEVWVYSLYTDQWSKYLTPHDKKTPKNVTYNRGVVIGGDIYILCRKEKQGQYTNAMWVLRNPLDKSAVCWEKVRIKSKQQLSPREDYGCWAYGGKLWIFGGCRLDHNDEPMDEYYNDLISFDPTTKTWCTQQCSGDIPSPRDSFGSDILDDKVWLFGGWNSDEDLDYLYTLHMESEPYVWTRIPTSLPAARDLLYSSITTVNNSLVLNGMFDRNTGLVQETWVIGLPSGSWRLHSRSDDIRECHNSCKGLNNDVIITGGYILEDNVNNSNNQFRLAPVEGNFMQHIVPEPKSLEQLALKAVHTHRNILPWKDPLELPRHLITRLKKLPE